MSSHASESHGPKESSHGGGGGGAFEAGGEFAKDNLYKKPLGAAAGMLIGFFGGPIEKSGKGGGGGGGHGSGGGHH